MTRFTCCKCVFYSSVPLSVVGDRELMVHTSAESLCPDGNEWSRGHGFLEDFFGAWTDKEPKFAGSQLSSFLLPSSEGRIGGE